MNSSAPQPLDSQRWNRIEALFHEAVALPLQDRAAFLEEACGEDTELRISVERFLDADAQGEALIDGSLEELAAPLLTQGGTEDAPRTLEPGTRIGRYEIKGVLGTGGMGTVYRAERADGAFEREVAIKMLRTSRLPEDAERRFERERHILARLQHPGIAGLIDGGVADDGQPFLVMEIVEGATIVAHAEEETLSVEARIELMISVAEAVDYAHRRLVVHRDLKPANILVDAAGRTKLLDFGIARLTRDDNPTDVTRTALLLTPDYAAPEQIRGEMVTTATDVYALGAVLYELLTLRRPFGRVSTRWADLQRVLEQVPPPLSRTEGLDRAWQRALDGDIDTVVQKALHKEPGRRYASAREFADDLRRYLDGRTVSARPDALGYRVSRFVGRNRLASGLAAAAVLATTLGAAGTAWQAREARLQAERGEAVGDFLFSLFEGADPELNPGNPVTAIELLEAGAARIDSLDAGPEARLDLLTTIGSLFGRLGESERSEDLLREAETLARAEIDEADPAYARALTELGIRLSATGNVQEAEQLFQESLSLREAEGASLFDLASTRGSLAAAIRNQGRYEESAALYGQAIRELDRTTDGDTLAFTSELMGRAQALLLNREFEEAEQLLRTVRRYELESGRERLLLGYATHNLGIVLAGQNRFEEAESAHREALEIWTRLFPQGHPEIARTYEQIARALHNQQRWGEADSMYSVAVEEWTARYGDTHTHLAAIRANQANLRYAQGDFDAAAEAYREGVRIWRANEDRPTLGVGLRNLGVIETQRGDYDAADTLLAEALALRIDLHGDTHVDVAETLSAIARVANFRGVHDEAERGARSALAQHDQLGEAEHPNVDNTRLVLGQALVGQGRWEEGVDELEPLHEVFLQTLNPNDSRIGAAALWLAIALDATGERDRAVGLLRDAVPVLSESLPEGAPDLVRARSELDRLTR